VTALVNGQQVLVARYVYDPFGNILSKSGPFADANFYQFASQELHPNSGLVYFGRRFYEPNLQRWLNRDPISERGGFNLYGYVGNNSVNLIDRMGLLAVSPQMLRVITAALAGASESVVAEPAGGAAAMGVAILPAIM